MFGLSPTGTIAGKLRRIRGDEVLVLEGATVIDGTGAAARPDATLVLQGGRIREELPRGRAADLPIEPAPVHIDVRGHYITPGLIDCHVHLTGSEGHDPHRRNIERYMSVRVLRAARDANRVLAAGFTTVRHLGHGDPAHAEGVKVSISQGLVAGPRMLTSGWALSQTGGHGNLPIWPYHVVEELRPRSAFCDGPDECRKFVRRQLGDGAEVIKIYTTEGVISSPDRQLDIPNFTLEEIEAITDEAHRRGARVAAHATGLDGAKNAVLGGVDTLEHGPNDPDEELLSLLQRSGATLVPTLTVFEWAAQEGVAHGLPAWAAARAGATLAGRRAMAKLAHDGGVTLALGSDSGGLPRGGRNADEIAAFARAGLTSLQAISAATCGGARALGLSDQLGTIEPGKLADLLVLRRDPIADLSAFVDPNAIRLVVQSAGTKEVAV